jgi:6-hydroxytryprostatin B O-methyltransferase
VRWILLPLTPAQHCATASLQVIQHYRIQDFVPLSGFTTYKEIATSIGKNITEAIVERVVQHAISFGLFEEDSGGNVCHNATSALLVTDPDLESWLYLCTNVAYKAGAHIPQAIDQYGASSEADETAYSVSIGRKISQFSHLRETKGGAAMFARAMKGISAGGAYDVTQALDGYPWSKLAASPNQLIVDVGGGPGHVAIALANLHPSLTFEVQDLPETIEVGAKNCPAGLRDRISFQSHDFFQVQPARDIPADGSITYFARFILHDWSDLYAQKILSALAMSLRPQDRIILNEVVVPAPGELPLGVERRLRFVFPSRTILMTNGLTENAGIAIC